MCSPWIGRLEGGGGGGGGGADTWICRVGRGQVHGYELGGAETWVCRVGAEARGVARAYVGLGGRVGRGRYAGM